ncbi:hypothetical protein SAMN04487917_10532 [Arthrobacter sp. yr096]|uniref:MauE/DoxX family redox-associated membrane protein n=1 Tax=Arthrobacter sp. yr096 TaxID=1761750 RepID=UPI0008BD0994|nr:hypothetical protein SAMN04487917_10532 [Arthrobacter sp. yr096]
MFILLSSLGAACTVLVAGILAWAAVSKIRRPWTMNEALTGLGLSWISSVPFAARIIPWGELMLAAFLLILPGFYGFLAAWLTVLIGIVLLWIVYRAHVRVTDASCSCFGTKSDVTRRTIARNAIFLVLALAGAALRPDFLWFPERVVPTLTLALMLTVVAALGWTMASAPAPPSGSTLMVPRVLRSSQLVFRAANGDDVALSDHLAGRAGVLVFLGEGEENDLALAEVISSAGTLEPNATVVTVAPGLTPGVTFADVGSMGSRLAGVTYYPTALLVGRDGIVATEPSDGAGIAAVTSLVSAVSDALAANNLTTKA